jgi:hypothetical protein
MYVLISKMSSFARGGSRHRFQYSFVVTEVVCVFVMFPQLSSLLEKVSVSLGLDALNRWYLRTKVSIAKFTDAR